MKGSDFVKSQIEIDQLHPIPNSHYILTPIGSGEDKKWQELSADDRHRFFLADCGDETLLYCILPNGIGCIDTKSKLIEKLNCPRCNRQMRPKIYDGGLLDPSEYVCDCGMTVEPYCD